MRSLQKHYGKITSLIVLLVILFFNKLGFNLSYFQQYIGFNSSMILVIIILFFILLYYFYSRLSITFRIAFLLLLFNIQALIISKFIKYVSEQNINSSMSEKSAAIALSWVILVPIVIIIFLILGIAFDYISLKSHKK